MPTDFKSLFENTKVEPLADTKPARLVIEGFANEEFWVTSVEGEVSPNFQLMYAIGPGAFLNAFNQRLSTFSLKGLHIPGSCDGRDDESEPPFMKFYKQFNIVTAGGTVETPGDPIGISFNNITLTGYVVKLQIREYSQQGIDGHAFVLMFLGVVDGVEGAYTADALAADTLFTVKSSLGGVQSDSVLNGAYNQNTSRGTAIRSGRLTGPGLSSSSVLFRSTAPIAANLAAALEAG